MLFSVKSLKAEAEKFCNLDYVHGSRVSKIENEYLFPGFFDVHVHFREPGFSYKETVATGCRAAAHGGYTGVFTMPNLNPVPDSLEHMKITEELIKRDSTIGVYPYASITVGEKGQTLVDMEALAEHCIAFSDDGRGVQDEGMMMEAMERAKALGKIIVAHCEVNDLLNGGYIHKGRYAEENGIPGICSESEWRQVERDVELSFKTGCPYHVCHISTKESVEIIRNAKKSGVDVSCETAPHYLTLDDSFIKPEGRFKMNPPLRDKKDREALIEGICDGTIEIIATDHAPHSSEEKSKGLKDSPFGITGLETAFPVLYTELVKKGVITLEKLIDLLAYNPRKRFNIAFSSNEFTVFNLDTPWEIDSENFLSKGKSTPFEGNQVYGKCLLTVYDGCPVWKAEGVEITE